MVSENYYFIHKPSKTLFYHLAGCRPGEYSGGHTSTSFIDLGNGNYLEQIQDQCSPCPIGQYQSSKSQSFCHSCPDNQRTVGFGSLSIDECQRMLLYNHSFLFVYKTVLLSSFFLALCKPHTFSENGLHPCVSCPAYHYQLEYGGIKCIQCTNDSLTSIEPCIVTKSSGIE